MSVSKETIKRGQPLLEGRDWLSSPAKREVLEAHSHPYLQTMKTVGVKRKRRKRRCGGRGGYKNGHKERKKERLGAENIRHILNNS